MAAGVQIEGLSATVRQLERAGAEITDLKEVFTRVARFVADDARNDAPTRTLALRASVRVGRSKNKALIRAGGRKAAHAIFQNNGYRGRPGLFFLEGAVRSNRARAVREINSGLADVLRRLNLN